MVYGLVYLAVRSNVKFSTKALNHTRHLLQRRLPTQVLSFPHYSQDNEDKKTSKTEKKDVKARPSFADGKSQIQHIIDQAKRGKISPDELTGLVRRVIAEGQYKNYSQAPQSAQCVAFASLAPMLGIPVVSLLAGHVSHCCAFAHLACGATILSFMGGSSWYEAVSKKDLSFERLGWAIMPQLIGWTSLCLPIPVGILFTSLGFCISLVHDILLTEYPPWMKSLRLVVTAGTLLSFILMLLFYMVL